MMPFYANTKFYAIFFVISLYKYDAVLDFDTAWRQLQNCKQRKAEKSKKKSLKIILHCATYNLIS